MAYYTIEGEGSFVECDGCGDVTNAFEAEQEWACLCIASDEGFDLCSSDCLWACNQTAMIWPRPWGHRPGEPRNKEMPF